MNEAKNFMITNKSTWTQLLETCRRPILPEKTGDLAIMQVSFNLSIATRIFLGRH